MCVCVCAGVLKGCSFSTYIFWLLVLSRVTFDVESWLIWNEFVEIYLHYILASDFFDGNLSFWPLAL